MTASPPSRRSGSDKRRPPMAARLVLLALAENIIAHGHNLQDVLAGSSEWQELDPRDRRFSRRLITNLLRHLGDARHVLSRYLAKPLKSKKAEIILLLAIAELIWAEGEPHAVTDQTVGLMRHGGLAHLTGLANAVLRKIVGDAEAIKAKPCPPLRNAPKWLREALIADWGDEAEPIMASLLKPPPLDLRLKHPETIQEWAKRLDGIPLTHGSVRLKDGMVSTLEGYDEGAWWVQDAAASLPALLIEDALKDGLKGKIVVDLCSAPGGKTAQLCAMGANVIAVDSSAPRLKILEQNMARLKMTPKIVTADGTKYRPDGLVDAVLLDAPCSATGTIRRHPDILSRKTPPDFINLNKIQKDLLAAAASWLKPQGVLVYATCSILKSEGEAIASTPPKGLTPHPIAPDIWPEFTITETDGLGLRIMPDSLKCPNDLGEGIPQGNDGFFIARFIKA